MPNKNYGVPYRELVENSAYGFKLKGDRYYGPNGWYFNADKYKNNPDTKAQWPILESPDTTEQSSIADEEQTIANEINNPKSDIELAMEYRERNPYFSATPMDNTVVNFGKSELFPHGRTTKVYTPDEIDAMLGYKPKPSTIDKILMGAFSLPVAYMVTAGGIVPTISSTLLPRDKSFTGLFNPCVTGPIARHPPNLCAIL